MTRLDYTNQENFIVRYPGRTDVLLNPHLCKKQKITQEGLEDLKALHYKVQAVLEAMEQSNDKTELRALNSDWRELQFELQKTWGFDQNPNFHHWYTVPKCSCPKVDNLECYGTPYGIYSGDCLIHGS